MDERAKSVVGRVKKLNFGAVAKVRYSTTPLEHWNAQNEFQSTQTFSV